MTNRSAEPYGKIEIIEEMHPKQGDSTKHVLVKPRAVLINGQEIYVAEDGIHIYTGYGKNDVTRVTIEFMPDDLHIRRVPACYIDRAKHLYAKQKDANRTADTGISSNIKKIFLR